jgi:hypothetical protein
VPRDETAADLILPANAAPDTMALRLVDGLRHALLVLLPRIGRFGIHAAGVVLGPEEDAVVLCGPSGCGKSTLTVGLLERGARLLSDDVVVLRPPRSDTEEGQLHGLTRRIRLTADGWERSSFTDGDRAGDAPGAHKHTIRDEALGPDARAEAGTPRRLVFPTITDRPTSRLVSVEAPTALRRLLEQMHPPAVLPRAAARAQFDAASRLLRQSTCHVLEAGRDLYDNPARIRDLLDDVPHRPAVRA